MTQTLKINRILDLVELTAVQVGQLTVEMTEAKKELAKKADKDDIIHLKTSLEAKLDEKADKDDIVYLRSSLEAKLDEKADKSDIQSLKESINQNDMVYVEMLLDHKTRLGKLERAIERKI